LSQRQQYFEQFIGFLSFFKDFVLIFKSLLWVKFEYRV